MIAAADILTAAGEVTGLGAEDAPPGRRERYLDLIAWGETERVRAALARCSGCALVVRGILRRIGFDDPELKARYRMGMAVADVVAIARRHGAWLPGTTPIVAGDIVLVGGVGLGGNEHVFVVVDNDGARVTSVDGGQVVRGFQAVLRCSRPIRVYAGRVMVGSRQVAGVARLHDS